MAVPVLETHTMFARRVGLSRQRVGQLVKEGMPTSPEGDVMVQPAIQWMKEKQSPARKAAGKLTGPKGDPNLRRKATLGDLLTEDDENAPPPTSDAPPEVIDYWAEKARKERAAASLAELKLATQKGELLPADEVRATVYALAKSERDAWSAWPSRVAPVLAARLGCDLGEIQRALVAEVNQHLSELAEVAI